MWKGRETGVGERGEEVEGEGGDGAG